MMKEGERWRHAKLADSKNHGKHRKFRDWPQLLFDIQMGEGAEWHARNIAKRSLTLKELTLKREELEP